MITEPSAKVGMRRRAGNLQPPRLDIDRGQHIVGQSAGLTSGGRTPLSGVERPVWVAPEPGGVDHVYARTVKHAGTVLDITQDWLLADFYVDPAHASGPGAAAERDRDP